MDSSSYLRYEFKAIRVVGSDLLPTKWSLKFDFQYTPTEENLEDFDLKVQSSLRRFGFGLITLLLDLFSFQRRMSGHPRHSLMKTKFKQPTIKLFFFPANLTILSSLKFFRAN